MHNASFDHKRPVGQMWHRRPPVSVRTWGSFLASCERRQRSLASLSNLSLVWTFQRTPDTRGGDPPPHIVIIQVKWDIWCIWSHLKTGLLSWCSQKTMAPLFSFLIFVHTTRYKRNVKGKARRDSRDVICVTLSTNKRTLSCSICNSTEILQFQRMKTISETNGR